MKNFIRIAFAAVILLAGACFCYEITGKVIGVKDGDTIEILKDITPVTLRLDGIDCPEKRQDFGQKAKEYTSSLCFGKTVKAVISDKDKYDRLIAKVILPDGKILNDEILKAGFAWHFKKYNSEKRTADMETAARSKRIGLWAGKDPVPPWDYRHGGNNDSKAPPVTGNFVGSAGSGKFHKLSCEWGKKIPNSNRIYFKTREEALKQDYKPCKVCNP
jgi:micrococcal nuclease